jgi:hypothetical protein
MTFAFFQPHTARLKTRRNPASLAVVALLLACVPGVAAADTALPAFPPIAFVPPTVDSVVSKVNGPILDLFDGALQIDVTNAKIVGGDDRLANPLPWSGILPGSRVVAQVVVPDVIPAVFPPRLAATNVVVFLANSGDLAGTIQGVNAALGTFSILYVNVKTNGATEWSGTKSDGTPVKGLGDLSAGMQAKVSVVTDASGVTARSVYAYAPPTTRIEAFRGKVDAEGDTLWTIGGRVVQVTPETKIVGDPKVGDLVDVVAKVQVLPPGSMAPVMPPVALLITKVFSTPPPPPTRFVEFDGVVESLPPAATPAPLGHWTISGRDVLVTPLTKVDAGIAKGTSVHVKGMTAPMSIMGPASSNAQIVATEITKK